MSYGSSCESTRLSTSGGSWSRILTLRMLLVFIVSCCCSGLSCQAASRTRGFRASASAAAQAQECVLERVRRSARPAAPPCLGQPFANFPRFCFFRHPPPDARAVGTLEPSRELSIEASGLLALGTRPGPGRFVVVCRKVRIAPKTRFPSTPRSSSRYVRDHTAVQHVRAAIT